MSATQTAANPERPWELIQQLIAEDQRDQLELYLQELTHDGRALALSRLNDEERTRVLRMLKPAEAAWILEDLEVEQAAGMIEEMEPAEAAAIVEELAVDEQADILEEMATRDAEAILEAMPLEDAAECRRLLEYDSDSAGGLMIPDFLSFFQGLTIKEAVEKMRENVHEYSDYEVQYAYVTGPRGRLRGVLRLRDLLLSAPQRQLSEIMIPNPLSVRDTTSLDELVTFFADHHFLGVPVVDADGRLLGVLLESSVAEATEKRVKNTFLRVSGIVGGEELRSLPLYLRCIRRLSWLAPNIVLNLIAASVISMYQDTLQAAIVLAVFLPIISDMSGCSGNQAVAVSIRELALGLIRPKEVWRVFAKEGSLGLINGLALGVLLGAIAAFWQNNVYLGMVVGTALALNTMLSVLLGGLVPLVLKGFKIDPALASGPLLTTVTDMCGFFLVLSFASMTLDKL